jgi:hypothetical protein
MNRTFTLKSRFNSNQTQNAFLTIEGSKLLVDNKGQVIKVNLNQITNVRIVKSRNLSLNILMVLFTVLFSYYLFSSNEIGILLQIILIAIIDGCVLLSLSLRMHSCKLLINVKGCSFHEVLLSKSTLFHANEFRDGFVNKNLIVDNMEEGYYAMESRQCMA